jgi:hypothetical protein
MTLVFEDGAMVKSGHYFYGKYLVDIPITGTLHDGVFSIMGADGGVFTLRFKGNGSEGNRPLDFNNSVGLAGSWSGGGRVLPVSLGNITMGPGEPEDGRRYAYVTNRSDAAFEAIAQAWLRAVLAGDRRSAARYTHFPLRVNSGGTHRMIRSASELSAQWDTIFTPAYLASLRKDMPHDMFGHEGLVSLGSGDAWFGDTGAEALNVTP